MPLLEPDCLVAICTTCPVHNDIIIIIFFFIYIVVVVVYTLTADNMFISNNIKPEIHKSYKGASKK